MRLDKTLLIPKEIQGVRSVVDELRETLCALCGGRLGGESCLWHFFPNGTWQTCSEQWAPAFFTSNFQFAQVATNLRDLHAVSLLFLNWLQRYFHFFETTTTTTACCLSRDTSEIKTHSHLLEGRPGQKEQSGEVIPDQVYPAVSCQLWKRLSVGDYLRILNQNS